MAVITLRLPEKQQNEFALVLSTSVTSSVTMIKPWHMQSSHLPLASFLQFVESGAKEENNFSLTDRSEMIQSALSIIRSASRLGMVKVDDTLSHNVNKIVTLLKSSVGRFKPHNNWIKNQDGNEHCQRLNQIHHSLTNGHFREDHRIDDKKTTIDTEGIVCKKQNKSEQPKQQTITAAVRGFLVPFGKVVQKRNMDDLEIELLFRGMDEEEMPTKASE